MTMTHMEAVTKCDRLERELAEAQRRLSEASLSERRLRGLLREMKAAMLGYPMSTRTLTPSALLAAINDELREPTEAVK